MELPLIAKTLVVWARLTTLDQSRGSALTLDDGHGAFDGIVGAGLAKRRWIAEATVSAAPRPQETATPARIVSLVWNSGHCPGEG